MESSMAVTQKGIDGLEKLYSKRSAFDKQILEAEKKLLAEAKADLKAQAKAAPKAAARKPRQKKPAK
jgi:hypothetical protein